MPARAFSTFLSTALSSSAVLSPRVPRVCTPSQHHSQAQRGTCPDVLLHVTFHGEERLPVKSLCSLLSRARATIGSPSAVA
jgi:hypothetical protein